MLHPKLEQARIAANITKSYKGTEKLVTPLINQIEFEKSVSADKINFILDDVMKSWSDEMITKLNAEKDSIKKSELDGQIQSQLSPLCKIDVVFDRMVKSVWVDIIDTATKTYKDNSLTQKLNLAGKKI